MKHFNAFTYKDDAESFLRALPPDGGLEIISVGDPYGLGPLELYSLYLVMPTSVIDRMQQELSDWRNKHMSTDSTTLE